MSRMSSETQTQLVKILRTVFPTEARVTRTRPSNRHYAHTGHCWACSKERSLFYFELVLLASLCIAALCIIALASSLIIKGGAALALWKVLRAITKHVTRSA